MKIQIFVVVFVVFSLYELVLSQSAADLAAYKEKQQACIKELKVPDAEAALIAAENEVANASEAYKCYHNCLYQKMGLVTADGKPNSENILKFTQMRFNKAPLDKIKTQLASCGISVAKSANNCDFVYNFEQCMVKALKA
ncbi:uncharacterized protein LOC115767466 [Drosophila novamexicana]|uniref:uncharacterized protein LOC115767466 n=1 Tax=Drosophila novamexicana TaxID=47314 RepID=UPI0011E5D946|nr:uncharacterized protein LOC115767466 [Drosophila novamexicana]XP_030567631.1 uncharacterized protein LOC115767466 [Drosophila novamexicana]